MWKKLSRNVAVASLLAVSNSWSGCLELPTFEHFFLDLNKGHLEYLLHINEHEVEVSIRSTHISLAFWACGWSHSYHLLTYLLHENENEVKNNVKGLMRMAKMRLTGPMFVFCKLLLNGVLRMIVRLVAFNFFERGLKKIIFVIFAIWKRPLVQWFTELHAAN